MIKYQVRSKELIDVVNEIKNKRLIMSPYFQRNLVWRLLHKIDFIKTILLGYPFPQIFIAKGSLDVENMQTTSCIVDGQQRMNSIMEFIKDKYKVDGKLYSEFTSKEKEDFLKYQIPIIDLDISNDSPELIEIFKRLNRTFYSLSTVEKLATEYAPSEFMLTAKFLVNEFKISDDAQEELLPLQNDPNIPQSFIDWASTVKIKSYNKFILESNIFTSYEISRKVHLMFTLNVMSTIIGDFYNRNDLAMQYLEDFSNDFELKDSIIQKLEFASSYYLKLKLKKGEYWQNKANAFSIITLLGMYEKQFEEIDPKITKERLSLFLQNLPSEYELAAKEGVNNKRERLIRKDNLKKELLKGLTIDPVLLSLLFINAD